MDDDSEISRRDLWRPGQLTHRPGKPDPQTLDEGTPLVCLTREAMACNFEIQFPQGSIDRKLVFACFDAIDDVERQLTLYRDDSEIARLNREARDKPIEVDSRLFDLLVDCRRLWSETGGAFDVTAGPLVKAWGFKRRQGRIPTDEEIAEARLAVGMQHVRLDPKAKTVQLSRPGMEINFGGVGKGYALDRVLERLQQAGCRSALVAAGGSSIRSLGSLPGGDGWVVDISSPLERGSAAVRISLRDRALSTSASTEQFFEHQGKRYGHILDPRTGRPAEGIRQATICAPMAARAEALSTAAFVLGLEWTADYCKRNPDVGAILFPEGETKPEVIGAVEPAR